MIVGLLSIAKWAYELVRIIEAQIPLLNFLENNYNFDHGYNAMVIKAILACTKCRLVKETGSLIETVDD